MKKHSLMQTRFFTNIKIFFLKKRSVTNYLGWRAFHNFIVQEKIKFSYLSQMYFLMRGNKGLPKRLIIDVMSDPDSARTIKNRVPIKTTLDALANYPEGTLGQAFYTHMRAEKLDFVAPLDAKISNDYQYIVHRILITHDIYHTLLGSRTDYYGEGLVAAFTSAQIPSYALASVHAAAGMLRCALVEPALLDNGNLGFVTGWLLGKSAKQLFSVDWDTMWHLPLEEVKKQLNINIENIKEIISKAYTISPSSPLPKIPIRLKDLLYNNSCVHEKFTLPLNAIDQKKATITLDSYGYKPFLKKRIAVAILGRAMFTNGHYLVNQQKPTLGACLAQAGIQVLIPKINTTHSDNFDVTIDEMIANTNQYIQFAKKQWPDTPIFLIGHSLSGISFLVQQGVAKPAEQVDGIVTLGAAPWNRNYLIHEPQRYQLKIKLVTAVIKIFMKLYGRVPARLLGYGNYDEHTNMLEQELIGNMREGSFKSLDKSIDYYTVLNNINCPVLSIASTDDEYARVKLVELFHANLRKKSEMIITENLTHMDLGASIEAWDLWEQIAEWIKVQVEKKQNNN